MNILVLGGNGFVGSALSEVLERKGHKVIRRSRRSGLDMTDPEATMRVMDAIRPEAVFNCAANASGIHHQLKYAATMVHDNARMALNLYEAVSRTCPQTRVISILSNCTYPGNATLFKEDEWNDGPPHISVFGDASAKRFFYAVSKCYELQHNIKTTTFIVPNAFGVGDKLDPDRAHAIGGMMMRMLKAKYEDAATFEVWGTGSPVREWIYIDDFAELVSRALEVRNIPDPLNLAQGCGASIKESAEAIKNALRYKGVLIFNNKYPDGAACKIQDDTKFRKVFTDYKFIDHAEAIHRTVAYYKSALLKAA